MGTRDRGPIEPLVDTEARATDAPSQVVLHRRGSLGGRSQAEHLEVAVRDRRERRGRDRRPALVELGGEAIERRRRAPRPRGTGARPRRRAPDARRSRGTRPAGRTRALRAVRSSTGRRSSGRCTRPASRSRSASALESSGPTTRMRSNAPRRPPGERELEAVGSRGSGRARRASPRPCADCPTSSLATSRTRLPSSGSRLVGGWKIAGSTAFGMTTGSRSSKPSSRCFASENSDWKIVADASAALTSAIRASVPSSNPRYAPIGPSTRCTIRAPRRAKRRRRRKSKLNELKRHTGVPPEIVPTSTSSPRRSSSRTSARRN